MLDGSSAIRLVVSGLAAGLQFNPLAAVVTAALAAGLSGYRKAPRSRVWWSAGVVLLGWAAGDGIRIAGAPGAAPYLVAWAIAGIAVGYALPAWLGAYVGRHVHKGTGWLSAGAVAAMFTPAVSTVAGALSAAVMRVAA